jgi:N utilization substance protein B
VTRHKARIQAFQLLYGLTATKEADLGGFVERTLKAFFPKEDEDPFFELLVHGAIDNKQALDCTIEGISRNWPLHRIGLVDLCILRLALFELTYPERTKTPPKVAIDEAIELAKAFGSEQSAAFVNGLLDAAYRVISGNEEAVSAPVDTPCP